MKTPSSPGNHRSRRIGSGDPTHIRSLHGPGPVQQFDHHAVGVGDLEEALAPLLREQREGDRGALGLESGVLGVEVGDGEGQDRAGRALVPEVGREDFQPRRRKITPAVSFRVRETKPSADIASW